MLRFFVTCVIRYAAHTQSRFGHPCNILSPPDILILHFLSSFSFTLLIVTCRILSLIPYSLMMGFALFVFVRHTAHCFLLLVNYLSCGWPCSGLFCLYMANEIEAWCNHTKNDRFKVSLPIDYFFERSVEQHYQNLHKLCTYQVRGGVPGADKVHLKFSDKHSVKTNFSSRRQKRFDILIWYQAR